MALLVLDGAVRGELDRAQGLVQLRDGAVELVGLQLPAQVAAAWALRSTASAMASF